MKFNLMKEVHIQCTQGMDVPWGRVSLQVRVNFAKVHQLRGREKTSLILLDYEMYSPRSGMSLQVRVNFAKVHQLRCREKASLIQLE